MKRQNGSKKIFDIRFLYIIPGNFVLWCLKMSCPNYICFFPPTPVQLYSRRNLDGFNETYSYEVLLTVFLRWSNQRNLFPSSATRWQYLICWNEESSFNHKVITKINALEPKQTYRDSVWVCEGGNTDFMIEFFFGISQLCISSCCTPHNVTELKL